MITPSLRRRTLSKVRIAKALIRFSQKRKKLAGITQSLSGMGKSPVDLLKFMSGLGDLPGAEDQTAENEDEPVKDEAEDEEGGFATSIVDMLS